MCSIMILSTSDTGGRTGNETQTFYIQLIATMTQSKSMESVLRYLPTLEAATLQERDR